MLEKHYLIVKRGKKEEVRKYKKPIKNGNGLTLFGVIMWKMNKPVGHKF